MLRYVYSQAAVIEFLRTAELFGKSAHGITMSENTSVVAEGIPGAKREPERAMITMCVKPSRADMNDQRQPTTGHQELNGNGNFSRDDFYT